jgi:hypothetical protein
MRNRLTNNWSLIFLVAFNLYLIWYYQQNPSSFKTLVCLYWIQSVMIGLFNALDLFLIKNPDKSMATESNPMDGSLSSRGCSALFFLVHYGGFHLAYAIFLLVYVKGIIIANVLLFGFGLLLVELTFAFIKRRAWEKKQTILSISSIFFMPYLRIIPMHLMILLPVFLGWNNVIVFLWLKMFTDVLMYIFTSSRPNRPSIITS